MMQARYLRPAVLPRTQEPKDAFFLLSLLLLDVSLFSFRRKKNELRLSKRYESYQP
jgi:hypothetical protein